MRLVLVIGAVLIVSACSQPPPSNPITAASAAAHRAADQFVAMAGDSAHTGKVPRQTDPAVAPLLDAVFDVRSLAHVTPSYDQLGTVNDWLGSDLLVYQMYLLGPASPTPLKRRTRY